MTSQFSYQPLVYTIDTVIANGQATSGTIDLSGTTLAGIHLPASFTGSSLSFLAARTFDGTYQGVYRQGADVSVTVAAGKYIPLNPADFAGLQFIKIVSGSTEVAARTLTLAVRPI
jgi:hypothetical protein